MAVKALLPPSSSSLLGVGWGGVALSWFPDGTGGGGTWGWEARHPEQRDLACVKGGTSPSCLCLSLWLSLCLCLKLCLCHMQPPFPKAAWVGGSGSR